MTAPGCSPLQAGVTDSPRRHQLSRATAGGGCRRSSRRRLRRRRAADRDRPPARGGRRHRGPRVRRMICTARIARDEGGIPIRRRWAGMPRPRGELRICAPPGPWRWPLLRRRLPRSGMPRTRTTAKPEPTCRPPTTATRGRYRRGAVRPLRSVVLPSVSIGQPGNVGGRGRHPRSGASPPPRQAPRWHNGGSSRRRSAVSESTPAEARPHGAMRSLTPAQRRQWQEKTLHSPRLRYGIPARLLFPLEDIVFGPGRSVPKFRALETINRVAYQAWEQAAYYLAGKLRERSARARQLHDTVEDDRTEQDNEKWHALILDELEAAQGRRESWFRFRLLPQLIAFAVYQVFWLMRVLRPSWAYRFNADIEDHAEHEYAQFVAEHPEWDATPFHSLAAPEYGRYDSLADVLRQIGDDEGVHKRISLDRLARTR